MASLNATTSSGIIATADNTGTLQLQSAGTTIANVTSTGLAVTGTITATGSLAGNGPSFRATRNGVSLQSLTNGVWNKVQFDVETWDTASCYDNTTNYRFTPNVAGYYYVDVSIELNNLVGSYVSAVYKNGTEFMKYPVYVGSTTQGSVTNVHGLVYLNGSTDYIEAWVYSYVNSQSVYSTTASYFSAFLARSA